MFTANNLLIVLGNWKFYQKKVFYLITTNHNCNIKIFRLKILKKNVFLKLLIHDSMIQTYNLINDTGFGNNNAMVFVHNKSCRT